MMNDSELALILVQVDANVIHGWPPLSVAAATAFEFGGLALAPPLARGPAASFYLWL